MARYYTIILLLLTINSYSQCGKEFIKLVKTDTCQYVTMGVATYADYYMHKKNLLEIKEVIPDIKDSLHIMKQNRKLLENNLDSLIKYQVALTDSLKYDRDEWKEIAYDLEYSLIDAEMEIHKQKRNRFKWFSGGALSALLAFLLL